MKKAIIRSLLKTLLAGFLHALKSMFAVATLAAAVALLICVPQVGGYAAVGQFVAAVLLVALSVMLFYNCGCDIVKGKFSK
jgi:uncharacterized membrane protein